jgi:hypothetical protein
MTVLRSVLCAGGALALGFGVVTRAHADNSGGPAVASVNPLALGNVVADASGVTIFHVDPISGSVKATIGHGVRTTSGSARALVTLSCGGDTKCSSKNVRVRVGSLNLVTGRGRTLGNFNVAMNTAILAGAAPAPGNPVDFTIKPIGRKSTASFYVGADVPIAGDDSSQAGSASAGFYVYVGYATAIPNSGSTSGLATASVTRALGLSAAGSLNFGTLIRPLSGTGTAVVDPDQGAYHNYNVIATGRPAPSRVVFTATGEPNKAISVSIPHDFNLVSPTGKTLNVTVSSNAGSAETLTSAGSYTFGVGGSINVSSTTPSGVYSGTFVVSIAYN